MHDSVRRATIADVAKAAGVSKAAVSFAFNAPERLSAETVARIRGVANALDYRPDPVARRLAQRRTGTFAVVTPHGLDVMFTNPHFGSFAAGVATASETAGYAILFISPSRGSLSRAVQNASVDGIIGMGMWEDHPEVERIRRSRLPFVLVDSSSRPGEASIRVDDESGAHAAARHLVALGHREFAVIAFTPSDPEAIDHPERPGPSLDVSASRLRGYLRAFLAAGIQLRPEAIAVASSSLERGAVAFRQLHDSGIRATAVLAMSDLLAIGVMRAARELGLSVPRDLSVIGFDDIDIARYTDPPLSTVHQPGRAKGDAAVRLLLDRLEGREPSGSSKWRLETRLVVRGSTGPVPGAPVPAAQQEVAAIHDV